MTDIGSNVSSLERQGLEQGLRGENAQPVRGNLQHLETPRVSEKNKPVAHRKHRVWESLTASLDLACRGYLCMQLVDCDPVTDPDCGADGKKMVVRDLPARDHSPASGLTLSNRQD